jgi:hypothetical protein
MSRSFAYSSGSRFPPLLSSFSPIAKRFKCQIFLSLDLPAVLTSSSNISSATGGSTNAQKILLDLELKVGDILKAKESQGNAQVVSLETLSLLGEKGTRPSASREEAAERGLTR